MVKYVSLFPLSGAPPSISGEQLQQSTRTAGKMANNTKSRHARTGVPASDSNNHFFNMKYNNFKRTA